MNIYDALRESHDEQRAMCAELLKTEPNSNERIQVFKSLRVELDAHAAAEERFLYCVMMMDDSGLTSSRHALAEHHVMEEMLEDLTTNDPTVAGWMTRAKSLCDKVHHHLKEEETKFFQLSGKILTEEQKVSLAKSYQEDYQRLKEKYANQ